MKFYRISGKENCQHESLSYLGADGGNNEYFLCQECGAAIVKEGKSDYKKERKKMEEKVKESPFDKFLKK